MATPIIFGLSGYAGSGKDTVADYLVDWHEFKRIAFGDTMKECLYALNPIVCGGPEDTVWRIRDLVDMDGWDKTKQMPEVRQLLQRFGTEAGRDILGENVWVNAAMAKAEGHDRVVFSDVRFPNEVAAVKSAGGIMVRIARARVGPANSHSSEVGLDDYPFDKYLINDRSIELLRMDARSLVFDELRARGMASEVYDVDSWGFVGL